MPDLTDAQKAALTSAQLAAYLQQLVSIHAIAPDGATGQGLKVSFDWTANTVTVSPGWYALPANNGWLAQSGHTTSRWDLPLPITLTIPDPASVTHPFLCLCYDTTTAKVGIWLIQHGNTPPGMLNVEYLAWRRGPQARWRVRYFHTLAPNASPGPGFSGGGEVSPVPLSVLQTLMGQ